MVNHLIAEAKTILRASPYDAAHALDHHQRVWNNAKWIIKHEKLEVDDEALYIAAWWHDVDKGSSNDPRLIAVLRRHRVPQSRIDTILAIMNQHSFEDEQTTIEGKILFDADKLEYVSRERWSKFLTALQKDPAKQDTLKAYQIALAERIVPVYHRLYFDATKQRFAKDYQQYRAWHLSQFKFPLPPLPPHLS
ncbi:MAG: HD domain-containing protein [Candidatus Gottesmanbacteria bacterium]|nr:HD domain-containing protein [Candidatus Gottesmanbacteria bacterium]